MPRRRGLTDRQIAVLPRKAKRTIIADPEQRGLYLRNPAGRTDHLHRRSARSLRQANLGGTTAELNIDQARSKAREAVFRIKAGKPAIEPLKPQPDSVAVVAQNWLSRHVEKNKHRTAAEVRRVVERYILPHWRDKVFTEIRRSDIAKLLDAIEDKHGPSTADHVLSALRQIASWVQSRDDDYVPPFVRGMRRVPKDQHHRARILTDDEIRKLWQATEDMAGAGAVLRIALLTAQRRSKVLKMRWQDLSPDGTWAVPTEAREKGAGGALKLPKVLLDLIKKQPKYAGSDRVFHVGNTTLFDANARVGDWRVHDLRRTARSLMSRAGVQSEHAERVLGHAIDGVEGIYNRHSYDDEKAKALEKLAALIGRIVNPPTENVVALSGQRG